MPSIVSIGSPGYFFAERHPGTTFSRVMWHAAGSEEVVVDFVNGYHLATAMAEEKNLRLSR